MGDAKLTCGSFVVRGESAVEQILQRFNRIELEFELFEVRWAGIEVWPIIRLGVFLKILTAFGVFSYRAVMPTPPLANRELVRRNPLFRLRNRNLMVFRWGQTMRLGTRPFDVYTDPHADALEQFDAEIVDLSPFSVDAESRLSSRTVRAAPLVDTWGRVATRLWPVPAEADDQTRRRLADASDSMSGEFHVDLRLLDHARSAIGEYFRQQRLWLPVFRMRRPRLVVLGIQSYGFEGLIAAARASGAVVAEIQHGLIYCAHLAYHFPDLRKIENKPDVLLTFGTWWTNRFNYPVNMEQYSIGFLALDNAQNETTRRSVPPERTLILTGDQFYGDIIVEAAGALRARFPDKPVSIRPHPSDSFDYGSAIARNHLSGVELADPRLEGIHQFLLGGSRVVGAASTALIESTALGLPTIGVLGGMTSVMGPVLKAGGAILCNEVEKLSEVLLRAPSPCARSPLFDAAGDRFHGFLAKYA